MQLQKAAVSQPRETPTHAKQGSLRREEGLNRAITSRCEHLGGENPEHQSGGSQGTKKKKTMRQTYVMFAQFGKIPLLKAENTAQKYK